MRYETIKRERNRFGPAESEDSGVDMGENIHGESNGQHLPHCQPSFQSYPSSGRHFEAYFSWPTSTQLVDVAEGRANFFSNLQKGVLPRNVDGHPRGQQASTLLDLMMIRAFHSKVLHCYSLGTAVGFRIRKGVLTNIPAIIAFVARKVHKKWLSGTQCLPSTLEGAGGIWCDVDVIEFSYYGAPTPTPKEELYDELVDGLRGSDPTIGSGSQVASLETCGTLGAIVKSRTGFGQVGFITNRHVAVDLDYPNQKMFHPLPPNLGPGVYLGAVERATSFITDDLWYGIFAGTNPETFVRADGAFIPFADDFDISNVTTLVKGVGEIGDVKSVDLQAPINNIIGRRVVTVGRSSGLTYGTVMAYSIEYDEKSICFFTDFLIVGENQKFFDLEGDSGSLILLTGEDGQKPEPIGIIWGGTANRGRLKLRSGHPPENWTSVVELGRLLDLLDLDLITTNSDLQDAVRDQRNAMANAITFMTGQTSRREETPTPEKPDDIFEPLGHNIQHIPVSGASGSRTNRGFDGIDMGKNVEELQFIPNSPIHRSQENSELKNLSVLRDEADEDLCCALHLGDREAKRKRSDSHPSDTESHRDD
ncbi:trypsin family protein isoform X2 [Wolffia australiana]